MPLLLLTASWNKFIPTGRTKGRRETGEPFRETHLEEGVVQILLVPSCVAPRFAMQVAEPSERYVLFGRKLADRFLFEFIVSVFNLFHSLCLNESYK